MLDILQLGSLVLHNASVNIANLVDHVDGLVGVTTPRGQSIARPEGHGSIPPARRYLEDRQVIIEGELYAATVALAWAQFDLLNAILADGLDSPQTLTWKRLGGAVTFATQVRTIGAVLPTLADGAAKMPYQLHLEQNDPAAYDVANRLVVASAPTASGGMPFPMIFPIPFGAGVVGGNVAATNAGNFPTWPTLSITGPISGPVVGNATRGEWLFFETLNVAAGDTLIIECDPAGPRTATVGGSSVMGTLRQVDAAFPCISRNAVEQFQFYGLGGGYTVSTTLSVASNDAYVS